MPCVPWPAGKYFLTHCRSPLPRPSHSPTGLHHNLTDPHCSHPCPGTGVPQLEPSAPISCSTSTPGELHGPRKPPTMSHYSQALPFLPYHTVCKAHLPHFIAERTVREKKLERHHHGVYSAPQVSFATSCLTRGEKFLTPTHASIISMREKLGTEMGAGSLDIFPHTHSLGSKYTGI